MNRTAQRPPVTFTFAKETMKKKYCGKWLIGEMEAWDKDFIDLMEPGHITIKSDGLGLLMFGAIQTDIDCRLEMVNDSERLDFTFNGIDEGDPICGRGWVELKGDQLIGRIYIHLGDDSGFVAQK